MSDFLYIAEVRLVKEQLLRLRPARSPPNKRILTTQILNIGPSVAGPGHQDPEKTEYGSLKSKKNYQNHQKIIPKLIEDFFC